MAEVQMVEKLNGGLGAKIYAHIKAKGLKQSFIADKANMSNGHFSNVLNDRVKLTQSVLDDINEALGTKFSFE